MDGDGQSMALRRLVDLPVSPLAQWLLGPGQHTHLHEARVVGDTVYLRRSEFGILILHDDRGAQSWLLLEPLGDLPVVHRSGKRCAGFLVELFPDLGIKTVQYPVLDVKGVEVLLPHEVEICAGRQTGRRPGVDPRTAPRAGLGIGDALGETVMDPHPEKLRMLPPAFRHVRIESTNRGWGIVDVAIDEGGFAPPLGLSLNHYSSS